LDKKVRVPSILDSASCFLVIAEESLTSVWTTSDQLASSGSMRATLLSVLLGLSFAAAAQQPEFFDVFASHKDGYHTLRIPSVVVTKQGSVLAFAEARQTKGDQSANDIVTKRSTDGGATWSTLQLIHDDGANSLNNPTAVVEQQSGRVFLMYQRIPAHLKEGSANTATGISGEDVYRNLLVWSDDDGQSWSKPQDVTQGTKRTARATTICSGPGIGIQLTRGPHKGRLIFPFNEGPFWLWQNFAVMTDDAGKTWRMGVDAPGAMVPDGKMGQRSQINEVQMVELNDGGVRLDSRQFGGKKVRKTAVSQDGGMTWSMITDIADITDVSCMAGILRYSFDDGKGLGQIIHTGPAGPSRTHGTVYLSLDDGATFPVKRELWEGKFAYSVPTKLTDGRVGVLFEADDYERTVFARFPMSWLTEGAKP
jgi:sialidase-1